MQDRRERHHLRAAGLVPCGVCDGAARVLACDDDPHELDAGCWMLCPACLGQGWVRPEPVMPEPDRSPEPWEWDDV